MCTHSFGVISSRNTDWEKTLSTNRDELQVSSRHQWGEFVRSRYVATNNAMYCTQASFARVKYHDEGVIVSTLTWDIQPV